MKKYIYIAMAAAAMFGCSKNEVPSADKNGEANEVDRKYVIYAEDINTKTVTDNTFSVKWTDKDNLAVYTWPVGTALPANAAEWQAVNPVNFIASSGGSSPRPFSLSGSDDANSLAEAAGIKYEGRLDAFKKRYGEGNNSLQWGVIYPGKQSNPSWAGYGIIAFGDFEVVHSTQKGNNNMAHLAYQDVLWGTATTTAENPVPTIKMKHIGTMMEYTVVNETSFPITVKSIKITANGAKIGGQFRFHVFEGIIDQQAFKEIHNCTLWVDNGEAIPANGSAKFYQVLAPFTLQPNYQITMTVETDKGTWTKTKTFNAETPFESGKRNPTTLKIDVDPTLQTNETGQVWFNPGETSSKYLNLMTAEKIDRADNFSRYSDVDAVVFRNSAMTTFGIAAPDHTYMEYLDPSVFKWAAANKKSTRFKKVASDFDFDGTEKMSELKSAYEASEVGAEADRIDLTVGDIVIAKTVEGNYALIKFNAGGKNAEGKWTDWAFNIKSVE